MQNATPVIRQWGESTYHRLRDFNTQGRVGCTWENTRDLWEVPKTSRVKKTNQDNPIVLAPYNWNTVFCMTPTCAVHAFMPLSCSRTDCTIPSKLMCGLLVALFLRCSHVMWQKVTTRLLETCSEDQLIRAPDVVLSRHFIHAQHNTWHILLSKRVQLLAGCDSFSRNWVPVYESVSTFNEFTVNAARAKRR